MNEDLIALYLIVAFSCVFGGSLNVAAGAPKEKRNGARAILIAPVWPLAIAYFLLLGAKALWAHAEWKKG